MTRGAKWFITACIVGSLVAIWLARTDPGSTAGARPSDSVDVVQQYDPQARERVTPFTATLLDGTRLRSDDLQGQVVVFNVWGSWCGPCRSEAPELASTAKQLEKRARFYGINVRDSPDAARAFERAFDIPYSSVSPDESASVILAFRGTLTAAAVPSTVVVDPDGAVAARVVGPVDAATLLGLVEDVLAEAE